MAGTKCDQTGTRSIQPPQTRFNHWFCQINNFAQRPPCKRTVVMMMLVVLVLSKMMVVVMIWMSIYYNFWLSCERLIFFALLCYWNFWKGGEKEFALDIGGQFHTRRCWWFWWSRNRIQDVIRQIRIEEVDDTKCEPLPSLIWDMIQNLIFVFKTE